MVDLLLRFYSVQRGGIFIDDINIEDVTLYDLRSHMGYVNQEAILFNDTFSTISLSAPKMLLLHRLKQPPGLPTRTILLWLPSMVIKPILVTGVVNCRADSDSALALHEPY